MSTKLENKIMAPARIISKKKGTLPLHLSSIFSPIISDSIWHNYDYY